MKRVITMAVVAALVATAGYAEDGDAAAKRRPANVSAMGVAPVPPREDAAPVALTKTLSVVTKRFRRLADPAKAGVADALTGAEVQISYPELRSVPGQNPGIAAINAVILKTLLFQEGDRPPFASVEELMDAFCADYATARKEDPEMIGGWSRRFEASVRYADDDILSVTMLDSSFMGGAHPNTNIINQVYSLQTGDLVVIGELFPLEQMPALNKLGEGVFRQVRGLKPKESLQEAGFNFEKDTFVLNQNFLMTKEGLTYVFNAYEIAPYALGTTELVIPWSDLKALVDPKGPATSFIGHGDR